MDVKPIQGRIERDITAESNALQEVLPDTHTSIFNPLDQNLSNAWEHFFSIILTVNFYHYLTVTVLHSYGENSVELLRKPVYKMKDDCFMFYATQYTGHPIHPVKSLLQYQSNHRRTSLDHKVVI